MSRHASEIDRLIEEGLTRYGSGDVDGALATWEKALAMDANNPQANSYVEYVRTNYEVLKADPHAAQPGQDYGFADDPEYVIEITGGTLMPGEPAPLYIAPNDEGWYLDDEASRARREAQERELSLELEGGEALELESPVELESPMALELEADEPPDSNGFEAATREYPPGGPRGIDPADLPPVNEFDAGRDEVTPGFGPEATPAGFTTQTTDIRQRDLGFVRPQPPELKVTVRTPPSADSLAPDAGTQRKQLSDLIESLPSPRPAGPTTRDLPDERRPPAVSSAADTLRPSGEPRPPAPPIGSADTLRPGGSTRPPAGAARPPGSGSKPPPVVETVRAPKQSTPPIETKAPTMDLPGTPRRPAQTRPPDPKAPTRELPGDPSRAATRHAVAPVTSRATTPDELALGVAPTREFGGMPTDKLPPTKPQDEDTPSVGIPTRDLGLRTPKRPGTMDDDEPTKQSDVRRIRDEAAALGRANLTTQSDNGIVGFDPIDARSSQILHEVDGDAPPTETKEERTRRRISSLLDRALAWNGIGEFDKAVTAVDLALNEDPGTALAQKLIHRNRDTIMTVFQNFIGDLQRTPALARPLHELASSPISPRAAFLLSRVDGTLSIDELLDVSGMPRLEAYRYLCQLFLRGILR